MRSHFRRPTTAWLTALAALATMSSFAWAQDPDIERARDVLRAVQPGERNSEEPERVKLPDYWIGLMANQISPEVRAQLNVPEDQGLIVVQVMPDSPAAKAGLKEHDILLKAKGKQLQEITDLVGVVGEAKDEEIEITFLRQGKEETVKVTPEKRPEGEAAREGGRDPEDVLYRFFGQNEGDRPIRMRFVHPGMMFPAAGLKHELPDDVRVEIVKEGKNPAKIAVHRGDKTWNVTEDNLKELPDDLRGHITALSGNMPMPGGPGPFNIRIPGPGEGGGPGAFRGFGEGGRDRVEQRLEEMNRRMRELREDLDRMRDDGPRRDPPPRGRGADAERRRPEPPRPPLREDERREERRGGARRGEDRRDEDRPGRDREGNERDAHEGRAGDA